MRTLKLAALTVGAVVLVVGLVLGFTPIKQTRFGIRCGTAFTGLSSHRQTDFYRGVIIGYGDEVGGTEPSCLAALSDRRGPALAVTGVGVLLLAAGGALARGVGGRSREAVS